MSEEELKEKIGKLFEGFKDPMITAENRKVILREINKLQKQLEKIVGDEK